MSHIRNAGVHCHSIDPSRGFAFATKTGIGAPQIEQTLLRELLDRVIVRCVDVANFEDDLTVVEDHLRKLFFQLLRVHRVFDRLLH